MTLTVRKEQFRLASGEQVDGYTVNHTSPGPVIRAVQGQLVEVRLVNASVPDGVTLHWHGVDVPNAEDGVAGVTQNAVPVGKSYTYRFVADQVGTYWYHSHQVSHAQVQGGLLGALVVSPPEPEPDVRRPARRAARVRRDPDHQRLGRRRAGGRRRRREGPGPGGQHRQRRHPGVDVGRAVPGAGGGRVRRQRADAGEGPRRPGSPPAAGSTSR